MEEESEDDRRKFFSVFYRLVDKLFVIQAQRYGNREFFPLSVSRFLGSSFFIGDDVL